MFELMKKDFIITKKVTIVNLFVTLLLPLFIKFIVKDKISLLSSGIIIAYVSIIIGMVLIVSIFNVEDKYSKAAAILTVSGLSKKEQVVARFVYFILIYCFTVIAYGIESMIDTDFNPVTVSAILYSLMAYLFCIGMYTLLVTKFGVKYSMIFYVMVIFLISVVPGIISSSGIKIDFSYIAEMNKWLRMAVFSVIDILLLAIFMTGTIRVYEKKEL